MSYIGRGLQAGAFRQLDDISSGFDGSDATHTMQVNSADVTVGDVNQILLSLGGVVQNPGTDFTVSGSVLTFTTAPAANTSFFAILLGSDNGGTVTPTDASVTAGKLAATVLTGQTDIGAAIVDADLFLVDDGAGGTLRKVTASRLKTYAGASSAFTEAVTITTADNLDTLTLTSTDADANAGPILKIQRDSGSPADSDLVGSIRFSADNDAGEQTNILQTNCYITDVSDGTEDFQFEIDGMIAGTQRNFITMYGGGIIFNEDSQDVDFRVESNGNTHMLFVDGGNNRVMINETSGFADGGSLTINHGANDGAVFELKNSDVAHGITDFAEADTYLVIRKANATIGGALVRGVTEGEQAIAIQGMADSANTTKSTSGEGIVAVSAYVRSGTSTTDPGSDANLFVVNQGGNAQFIVDTEGQLHSNGGAQSAYDTYEDAHLVRAFDLSHGKGVIDSKFDKFISYNHEKLADMKLVGREEDGTPNHFINVTGMQRLHNGAIWQQYEKTEKLTNAMYELAKAAVGEEKANEILEQNDIKLLN